MSGKDLAKRLERAGWRLIRVHGSHHLYRDPHDSVTVSIPIHSNRDLKKGLLKYLLKATGVSPNT